MGWNLSTRTYNSSRISPEEVIPLGRRIGDMARSLAFWASGADRRFVYWVDRRGRGCFLQATPIELSNILSEKLFGGLDTVVLTSATLAVSGNFEHIERRLGARRARAR